MSEPSNVFDIAIIGAGVVGCAIARELSRYDVSCVLLDAEPDVGCGTSKANTAIWHTGFDAKPGSLEAKLLRRSYSLLSKYVPEAGIPHEKCGAVLIAWNEDQLKSLPVIMKKAKENGVRNLRLLSVEEVYNLEPNVNSGALGGILVPGEFIICTFSLPLAFAKQAVLNGVETIFNFKVEGISRENQDFSLIEGTGGEIKCRYVINAAGLNSDVIDNLLGFQRFTVTPRRGELIVFDKLARPLVKHVLLPVPTAKTKGVLVSPTVYGNIMLGPTAEDLNDKTNTETSQSGLEYLWEKGEAIITKLLQEEVTSTYAGLRAATEHSDYQIYSHPEKKYICVGGIRSTGLSASMGIAEYVVGLLREAGQPLSLKSHFKTVQIAPIGEAQTRAYQDEQLIAKDPDYGKTVCFCEKVTRGEIIAATMGPLPAPNLDALKRRTRCTMGRCQGFHCHADVTALLDEFVGSGNEGVQSD